MHYARKYERKGAAGKFAAMWPAIAAVVLAAGLPCVSGCGNSRRAAREVSVIQTESRRFDRVPFNSAPDRAKLILGRGPDAYYTKDEVEYHYYRMTGLPPNQLWRLAYRNGHLIEKKIVTVKTEH